MGRKPERRRRLLINRTIQFGYWKVILVGMFLPTLLLFAAFYQFLDQVVIQNAAMNYEQTRALLDVFIQTSIFLMISFPIVTAALLLWSLIISNKVAGPIYRMERDLAAILDENSWNKRIKLRQGDELQDLADEVNRLLEKLQTQHRTTS